MSATTACSNHDSQPQHDLGPVLRSTVQRGKMAFASGRAEGHAIRSRVFGHRSDFLRPIVVSIHPFLCTLHLDSPLDTHGALKIHASAITPRSFISRRRPLGDHASASTPNQHGVPVRRPHCLSDMAKGRQQLVMSVTLPFLGIPWSCRLVRLTFSSTIRCTLLALARK